MAQLTIQQAFDLALQNHQAGQLREAEQLYRQILAQQPNHADAMHNLGLLAHQAGRHDMAVGLVRRALALNPGYAQAHNNLGNILKETGHLDEAIAAYRRAVALRPGSGITHFNLGNALNEKGQLDEAIIAYRQAIALRPGYVEAYNNLGNALLDKGHLDEAIVVHRQAIALSPNLPEPYNNLAIVLKEKGQLDEAIAAARRAIELRPDYAEAYYNLGNALQDKRQLDEAIAATRQAIALKPSFPKAHTNLGNALQDKEQFDEAIAEYRQAIAQRPNSPVAYNNLGNALRSTGQLDESIAAFRQAIALNPDFAQAHGNLAWSLHFHAAYDARAIAEEHRRWNRQHAARLSSPKSEPLRKFIQFHSNDRTPDHRLRLGYVSPDLRDHVVGRNLLPLFQQHDRRQFDITCYAQVPRPDAMTRHFQQNADQWRSTVGLTDEQLAGQIRADRIDVLVDLALHTANNRLLVFARKPAPVQVTFAGYPGSTGLTTIDYRLSDPYLDPFDEAQGGPPGMDESVYSEQTICLPHSFWCYDPLDCRAIPVNSLPALKTGVVTFGSLNNFCKVNDSVLTVWAQVLRQVENSRLLLMAPRGNHRQRTVDRLCQEGIDPGRLDFVPRQSRPEYLEVYHRIDLGLDTFPYNGHTTSLDSFWMGVPVVALVGERTVSRAGWSQLSNLGLSELAGHIAGQFVRIAVELAKDLPRLQALRSTLRGRMEQSPLMDAPKFARDIESAYRQMWRTWCETGTTGRANLL